MHYIVHVHVEKKIQNFWKRFGLIKRGGNKNAKL